MQVRLDREGVLAIEGSLLYMDAKTERNTGKDIDSLPNLNMSFIYCPLL